MMLALDGGSAWTCLLISGCADGRVLLAASIGG